MPLLSTSQVTMTDVPKSGLVAAPFSSMTMAVAAKQETQLCAQCVKNPTGNFIMLRPKGCDNTIVSDNLCVVCFVKIQSEVHLGVFPVMLKLARVGSFS